MAPKKVKTSVRCPKCGSENPQTSLFCAACGTKLSPAEDKKTIPTRTIETPLEELRTGSTFAGRYQIIEELGRGGMGRVYRALDQKLDEEVALKLIRPEIALDKKTLERFHNELKLARKISHRNIGRMYELLEDRGRHFITMEYVPGQDLRGLIRQTGQLTPAKAVSIAQQVCQGLAEAHRLGIIHRDLKPSNIIIDRDGNARSQGHTRPSLSFSSGVLFCQRREILSHAAQSMKQAILTHLYDQKTGAVCEGHQGALHSRRGASFRGRTQWKSPDLSLVRVRVRCDRRSCITGSC